MNLTIGSWVRVRAVTSVYYQEDGTRMVGRTKCEPFDAQITGQVVKPLGQYVERRRVWGDEDFGYLPGRFKPTGGSVTLWLARPGLVNKEVMVSPEDVEPIEPATLPRLAIRPRLIWPEVAVILATLLTTWGGP